MTSFGEIKSAAGSQSTEKFVDVLIGSLPPIYDKESEDTNIRKIFESLAEELKRVDIILETVQNNNFLSVPVEEELLVRGSDGSDRLKNENAFELSKIRITPANNIVSQNVVLQEGENIVQLLFIPEDIDFVVSRVNDRIPLNFPTEYNSEPNTLTITSSSSGAFTVRYKDSGDVIRFNENVEIPEGLFRLGYSEGGYGELGYGE